MSTNEHYNNLAESFSQLPVNTDACCTNSLDVVITPVRYAIDDLIDNNDTGLKGDSLHSDRTCQNTSRFDNQLKTRHFTMRQLRDGWLYVYDQTTQQLDEYKIKGSSFVKQGKEQTSLPYIKYPACSILYLFFCPVQLTDRLKKGDMFSSSSFLEDNRWVKKVDLPKLCSDGFPYQTGNWTDRLIPFKDGNTKNITRFVSDIKKDSCGNLDPFYSTSISTIQRSNDMLLDLNPFASKKTSTLPVKNVIYENTIMTGDVIDSTKTNQSLNMIAILEDPFAVIDDLILNILPYYAQDIAYTTDEGRRAIEIAQHCISLTFSEIINDVMPLETKNNLYKRYSLLKEITNHIRKLDSVVIEQYRTLRQYYKINENFKLKTKYLKPIKEILKIADEDLNLDDMFNTLIDWSKTTYELDCRMEDIITYLNYIGYSDGIDSLQTNFIDFGLDNTNINQATMAQEICHKITFYISHVERGRQWIKDTIENNRRHFITLSPFNFDFDIYSTIRDICSKIKKTTTVTKDIYNLVTKSIKSNDITNLAFKTLENILNNPNAPLNIYYDTLKIIQSNLKNPNRLALHTITGLILDNRFKNFSVSYFANSNEFIKWKKEVISIQEDIIRWNKKLKLPISNFEKNTKIPQGSKTKKMSRAKFNELYTQWISQRTEAIKKLEEKLKEFPTAMILEDLDKKHQNTLKAINKRSNDLEKTTKNLDSAFTAISLGCALTSVCLAIEELRDAFNANKITTDIIAKNVLTLSNSTISIIDSIIKLNSPIITETLTKYITTETIINKEINTITNTGGRFSKYKISVNQLNWLMSTPAKGALFIGCLVSIYEMPNIVNGYQDAKTTEEKIWYGVKIASIMVSVSLSTIILVTGITAGPIGIILSIAAGFLYLISSYFINSAYRTELQAWMKKCYWRKHEDGYNDIKTELTELYKIHLCPVVKYKHIYELDNEKSNIVGVWVDIYLSSYLEGSTIQYGINGTPLRQNNKTLNIEHSNWINLDYSEDILPNRPPQVVTNNKNTKEIILIENLKGDIESIITTTKQPDLTVDAIYVKDDKHRICRSWIPLTKNINTSLGFHISLSFENFDLNYIYNLSRPDKSNSESTKLSDAKLLSRNTDKKGLLLTETKNIPESTNDN